MTVLRIINVDLEIHSAEPLDLICAEFSPTEVSHLYNGKTERGYFASFEADFRGENSDNLISRICDLVLDFSDDAKKLWFKAGSRVFDIGYEHTKGEVIFNDSLSVETIEKLHSLKASITFTAYPWSPEPSLENLNLNNQK